MNPDSFISQSLSPAIAISGVGLIILGLTNKMSVLGSRIRDLNRLRLSAENPHHRDNMTRQVHLFMHRFSIMRWALFLLYMSVAFIVITEFGIAINVLMPAFKNTFYIYTFLTALLTVFLAVLFEAYETTLNLKSLRLDIHYISVETGSKEEVFPF